MGIQGEDRVIWHGGRVHKYLHQEMEALRLLKTQSLYLLACRSQVRARFFEYLKSTSSSGRMLRRPTLSGRIERIASCQLLGIANQRLGAKLNGKRLQSSQSAWKLARASGFDSTIQMTAHTRTCFVISSQTSLVNFKGDQCEMCICGRSTGGTNGRAE